MSQFHLQPARRFGCPLGLRDVGADEANAFHLAMTIEDGELGHDVGVLAAVHVADVLFLVDGCAGGIDHLVRRHGVADALRRQDLACGLAYGHVRGEPEAPPVSFVGDHIAAVGVLQEDRRRRVLDEGAQPLLAVAQRPFGGLSATTPGFSRIAQAIAKLGLPTTIVQEGGYLCDALGDNLTAFLTGFAGAGR